DGVWPVEVDRGQMAQVVHNLVINARQAMPKGGAVRITCENATVVTGDGLTTVPAGRYVRVSVEDEGVGIEKANLAKIFDPFFTTKPSGTGLGLTTTYSIVKRHGGQISCESEP